MATDVQPEVQLSKLMQCPVCFESFKLPKVLPCGHTYCASCLQSHINNKVTQRQTTKACFTCPVCNVDIVLNDPNICIEMWAESFPVNSIASSLIVASARNKEYISCDQCIKESKNVSATYFCENCDQSMCMSCKKYHDGFPSLRKHKVINVSNTAECFDKPDTSTIEACKSHCAKRIKYYCEDHNTMCCTTCVILAHRKCERVLTLEDMMKSFDISNKSREINLQMANFLIHLNQIILVVKSNLDTIQKEKDNILEHIHSLKVRSISHLKKLAGNIIESLECKYKSENCHLQTIEGKGLSLVTSVDNDRTQQNLIMTHGSEVQKVIMLHNLDKNQERYFIAISEFENKIKDVSIHFAVNKTFSKFVNTVSKLGTISLISKHADFSSARLKTAETNFRQIEMRTPINSHVKERIAVKVSKFKVKTCKDMNRCHITHILHLMDTRILLVDFRNYKLKLYGRNYNCHEALKFQERPWFACSLSDTEVAVTVPVQKKVHIIEIKGAMRNKREVTVRFECWGIAAIKDQLVITTRDYVVLLLDMYGTEIRIVHMDKYLSEANLKPNFIKYDTSSLVTYISYESAHTLIAYSVSWDVLFTYTNQDLTNATGIDIDKEGNIYLCGYNTHCVQQISAKGELIKELVSQKKEKMKPLSITFVNDTDRFFLTYGDCDFVDVFELRVS